MKKILLISFLIIMFSSCKKLLIVEIQTATQIIPEPRELTVLNGTFEMTDNTYK